MITKGSFIRYVQLNIPGNGLEKLKKSQDMDKADVLNIAQKYANVLMANFDNIQII